MSVGSEEPGILARRKVILKEGSKIRLKSVARAPKIEGKERTAVDRPPEPEGAPKKSRKLKDESEPMEEEPHDGSLPSPEEECQDSREIQRKARAMLEEGLEKGLKSGLKISEVGTLMLNLIERSNTKLGRFRKELKKFAVAPGGPAVPRDLLPISLEGIGTLDGPWSVDERNWLIWICLVLNFWFCTGWEKASNLEHSKSVTQKQKVMLEERLWPSVRRLCEGDPKLPSFDEVIKEMGKKGQDYDSSTWVVMETLETEKVVACWPSRETAAIQPIARYLTGETRRQLECPMSTILPHDQWPATLTKSKVRASDEVWNDLVTEGYKRGLFQPCPDEEVLRGPNGEKILNGAGAVPKEKHGKQLQRFISIFCPLNEVSVKVQGDESTLPYVGQVLLLNVPREHEVLIDSEDMESAFNLFLMPEGFRGLFCYEKQVLGSCVGLDTSEPTWVSLRTVPMGWLSAVGIVQAAIRHLAFVEAGLPLEAEVRKGRPLPEKERFLLYLDSVDQLRVVSKRMAALSRGEPSEDHLKFEKTCEKHGLPRNAAKRLAGALHGSLQGGELLSEDGIFTLQLSKIRLYIAMALVLATLPKWTNQQVSGVVGRLVFACAFRRPLLSVLQDSFRHYSKHEKPKGPTNAAYDEIVSFVGLLPLAYTNVRASLPQWIHATDASPTGAGSCTSNQFKDKVQADPIEKGVCVSCRRELDEDDVYALNVVCPARCGRSVCSLECYLEHVKVCPMKTAPIPTAMERWSGPNAPLSQAMVEAGINVLPPYDVKRGDHMDYFSAEGKATWDAMSNEDPEYEHHAPDCKTFSRARGKKFQVDGRWYDGPPALRDENNVLGFSHLRGENAVRVRQGNKMALRSVARCEDMHSRGREFSLEHPYRSWLWYTKPAIALAKKEGVRMAVFSNCCFGGRRKKWTAILTNSKWLFDALHRPDCPHDYDDQDYQPYWEGNRIRFPTEEEAEYPWKLCQVMARALRQSYEERNLWDLSKSDERRLIISRDLEKYNRVKDPELREAMISKILEVEELMVPGNESQHIEWLFRQGHYRGTDIRLTVGEPPQMVPYPALKWMWRECLSFRWKGDGHINELEAHALIAHLKRVIRGEIGTSARLIFVLDSQVIFFAVSKGRSPSTRLNRILRKIMALQLASDTYLFPLWTISAWNWADIPSRR